MYMYSCAIALQDMILWQKTRRYLHDWAKIIRAHYLYHHRLSWYLASSCNLLHAL